MEFRRNQSPVFLAGYVVSKETLRRFIEESLPDPKKCHIGIGPLHLNEDEEFGACLQSIGILPGNTKDTKGRARFVPIDVANYVRKTWKKKDEWKQVSLKLGGRTSRSSVKDSK